jgi:hypothetical protein
MDIYPKKINVEGIFSVLKKPDIRIIVTKNYSTKKRKKF